MMTYWDKDAVKDFLMFVHDDWDDANAIEIQSVDENVIWYKWYGTQFSHRIQLIDLIRYTYFKSEQNDD